MIVEHAAFGISVEIDDLALLTSEASHCGCGKVGAVRGAWDQNNIAHFVAVAVIRLEELQANELTLRTSKRLSSDGSEAGDFLKPFLRLMQHVEATLRIFDRSLRMNIGEARQTRRPVVDLRVILHGARAERIATVIRTHIEITQTLVVIDHLVGGISWQAGSDLTCIRVTNRRQLNGHG